MKGFIGRKEVFSMKSKYEFKSKLAIYMETYIHLRASTEIEIDVNHFIYTYKQLDEYLVSLNHDRDYINKNDYDGWYEKMSMNAGVGTIYRKVSTIRQLLTFMSQQGQECYIPRLPKKHKSSFVPYIYTREEIRLMFDACDELRAKARHPKTSLMAIPTIIRLLYSTAIRISEALNIKMKDLDFERHVIVLNKTKNGSQRLAPINRSMETVIRLYLEYRDRIGLSNLASPESYLFVSTLGNQCKRDTIYHWFEIVREKAGIPYKGNHEGPRIHDIRHTACVHSLVKMLESGTDIYCYLPILSMFVGHKSIYETETYLRLTGEYYPDLMKMDASVISEITNVLSRSLTIKTNGNI
jgi:integrase